MIGIGDGTTQPIKINGNNLNDAEVKVLIIFLVYQNFWTKKHSYNSKIRKGYL